MIQSTRSQKKNAISADHAYDDAQVLQMKRTAIPSSSYTTLFSPPCNVSRPLCGAIPPKGCNHLQLKAVTTLARDARDCFPLRSRTLGALLRLQETLTSRAPARALPSSRKKKIRENFTHGLEKDSIAVLFYHPELDKNEPDCMLTPTFTCHFV